MKVEVDRKSFGFIAMLLVLAFALILLASGIWDKANQFEQNENIIAGLKAKSMVVLEVPRNCSYALPTIQCLSGYQGLNYSKYNFTG